MNTTITHWQQFGAEVRARGGPLLKRLDEFPRSVLVTGCQRSGTTMLANLLIESEGMTDYRVGRDSELDGALILAGVLAHEPRGRYCFQTTYLNESYREYERHDSRHKIIWVLRNPFAVVYSMLYNWKDYALDELFAACGAPLLSGGDRVCYQLFGLSGVSRLRQACLAYKGKLQQLFELRATLGEAQLMVVSYETLVRHKEAVLPTIYRFADMAYDPSYAQKIHQRSLSKQSQLTDKERRTIQVICEPVYRRALALESLTVEQAGHPQPATSVL